MQEGVTAASAELDGYWLWCTKGAREKNFGRVAAMRVSRWLPVAFGVNGNCSKRDAGRSEARYRYQLSRYCTYRWVAYRTLVGRTLSMFFNE